MRGHDRIWFGWRSLALAVFLPCALLAGCGAQDSPVPEAPGEATVEPPPGGTVTLGTHHEPTTFVDWNARTTWDLLLGDFVFPRLARPGAEPGSYVPDLAEAWEFLPDGKSIRFRLRDDRLWEDGQPVTAADVAFSNERQITPESSFASYKGDLRAVEITGELEIVFHFARSYGEMLTHAVAGHVYPRHLLEPIPEAELKTHPFNRNPVGAGPFRLEHWEPQQYIALEAVETPRGRPYLDRLVVRIFKDKSAVYRELEAGSLDLVRRIQIERYHEMLTNPTLRGIREPSSEYVYLTWNARRHPWDITEVRRAMTALIDRGALARHFEGEGARIAEGPVPPGDPRYDEALVSPSYDPETARGFLRGAGLRSDSDGSWLDTSGNAIEVTILTLDHPLRRDIGSLVADALRQGGFKTQLRTLDDATRRQRVDDGEFDVALFIRPSGNPVDLPECFGTGGIENRSGLSNPELDRLLARSDDETFRKAYKRIVELQPWTFLYYRSESFAYNARLRGLEANPRDPVSVVEQWWIPRDLR